MKAIHIPFRAEKALVKIVKDAARKTGATKSLVMREALYIGVPEFVNRMRPKPADPAGK